VHHQEPNTNLENRDPDSLISDATIAQDIGCQTVTMRVQRHYRKRGKSHWFTLDAVMVGSMPRYRLSEYLKFRKNLKRAKLGARTANPVVESPAYTNPLPEQIAPTAGDTQSFDGKPSMPEEAASDEVH